MPTENSARHGDEVTQLVDDRDQDEVPDGCDKLGDPNMGRGSPGRCHVCLAWVRYPYSEASMAVCPDCNDLSEAEREMKRREVKDALEDVWGGSSAA